MKLGILSDTHDQLFRCERAIVLLQAAGAEVIVHCGDVTEPEIIQACAVLSCYFVFGNNDYHSVAALREIAEVTGARSLELGGMITLAEKTIAVTHGHLRVEERRLLARNPDYFLSGHTHVAEDRRAGPTRFINPGALHRARQFTVAVLDLCRDELKFIPVLR